VPLVSGTELGPYEILAAIGAGGTGNASAALNHSNSASIHQIEEASGSRFPVGKLVDGETLADRLNRRALPVRKPSSSQDKSAKRWKRYTTKASFTATPRRQGSVPTAA